MRRNHISRNWRRGEQGYAMLMMLFIASVMIFVAMEAAPRVATEGRRDKEQMMIWRGKQYARGVKLFYRKRGKFPTSMDDLVKPSTGMARFMRQEYKDPMNKEDGTWRLIYVGPAGQLVGSLKPPQNLFLPNNGTANPGVPTGSMNGPLSMQSNGTNAGQSMVGTAQSATGSNTSGDSNQGAGAGMNDNGLPANVPSDTPTIVGGNIIGVGSKVNQKSVIVYEKAKNYKLFEFIWDPSKDVQQGQQGGTQLLPNTNNNNQPQNGTTSPLVNPSANPPTGTPDQPQQ